MKCKHKSGFAENEKFNRKQDKIIKYHKKVNWFRAFMLLPWQYRLKLGKKEIY